MAYISPNNGPSTQRENKSFAFDPADFLGNRRLESELDNEGWKVIASGWSPAHEDYRILCEREVKSSSLDRFIVAANHVHGTSSVAKGARCLVLTIPGANDRAKVRAKSRGGRWIEFWVSLTRLEGPRIKTIPPEHPLYKIAGEKSHAQSVLRWMGVA